MLKTNVKNDSLRVRGMTREANNQGSQDSDGVLNFESSEKNLLTKK